MRQPGVGNPESGSGFPTEMPGMRASGYGTPEAGREKYQRTDKERITEREKEIAVMKKMMNRTISILLAVMIMVTAIPVMAASQTSVYIPKKSIYTWYPSFTGGKYEIYHGMVSGAKATVKSDNTKVVTARFVKNELLVTLKKPGTANLKVKVGKKTYTSKVVVKKYENPLESVKVGKTTIKGKAFNKNNITSVKYSKFANKKTAIKFNVKKGWKVTVVAYGEKKWQQLPNIKNGSSVKVKGGKGFKFLALVENKKTGQTESVVITLN